MDDPTPTTRPFQWAVVALAGAVFALLALSVWHSSEPRAWERPILTAVEHRPLPLRGFWTAMFEPVPFALTSLALAAAAAARGRFVLAVAGLAGCLAAVVSAELVLKPLVDRVHGPRVGLHHHLIFHLGGPMFPSAHVTAAAAWATFAWLILDRRSPVRPLLLALPPVVGWAVIARQMHYPADVAGGLLLGPAVVYCTVTAANAVERRRAAARGGAHPDVWVDTTV